MTDAEKIKQLVETLVNRMAEENELSDTKLSHKLGPPNSEERVADLERRTGFKLPADYRAFLLLHNGWQRFSGSRAILSIEDMASGDIYDSFIEFQEVLKDDDDTAAAAGFVISASTGTALTYYDRESQKGDAPPELVDWRRSGDARFPSFTAYLEDHVNQLDKIIEREKKNRR